MISKMLFSSFIVATEVLGNAPGITEISPQPLTLGLFSTPEIEHPVSLEIVGKVSAHFLVFKL